MQKFAYCDVHTQKLSSALNVVSSVNGLRLSITLRIKKLQELTKNQSYTKKSASFAASLRGSNIKRHKGEIG